MRRKNRSRSFKPTCKAFPLEQGFIHGWNPVMPSARQQRQTALPGHVPICVPLPISFAGQQNRTCVLFTSAISTATVCIRETRIYVQDQGYAAVIDASGRHLASMGHCGSLAAGHSRGVCGACLIRYFHGDSGRDRIRRRYASRARRVSADAGFVCFCLTAPASGSGSNLTPSQLTAARFSTALSATAHRRDLHRERIVLA
jgi:hypothetical protein